jgi:hypothetical protein
MTYLLTSARLPRSGNAALASGALIQAAIGAEFVLAGLNKAVNPDYLIQFRGFLGGSPGTTSGPLAPVFQTLVVPYADVFGMVAMLTELVAGAILVVTALEVARRRLAGPIGAQHGYEPLVALVSATAAFVLAAISLTIYVLQGGRLPGINPGYALASPIALELLLVPLALGIAWLEFARFRALRAETSSAAERGSVMSKPIRNREARVTDTALE